MASVFQQGQAKGATLDARLSGKTSPTAGSELSPSASSPVTSEHGDRDQQLDGSDHTKQGLVPDRAAGRQHPDELQHGGRNSQHAKGKSDQNQPERPSPSTEDPGHEESDKPRKRNQKRRLDGEGGPANLAAGLPV